MVQVKYKFGSVFFFFLIHMGVLAVWWNPPTLRLLAWLAVTYSIRMFGVTAGYHRYFGHRSYKLGTHRRSLQWRFWPRLQPRRECCGGRRITGCIIANRIATGMSTRPPCAASGGRTWAGCFQTISTNTTRAR